MRGKHSFQALGRLPKGQMNKTEAAYEAEVLKPALMAGDVLWYRFEGVKLRLADGTFYTPDFAVLNRTGLVECREIKGWWTDDARVKIKVAADQYPFEFTAIRKGKKSDAERWLVEVF